MRHVRPVSIVLAMGGVALGCSEALVSPPVDQLAESRLSTTPAQLDPGSSHQVMQAVTGSGHLYRGSRQYWLTFTIHAQKTGDGTVRGSFQWRAHEGGSGSKVSGRVDCFSVEGDQAWLGVVFEKAGNPANIGKWASISVVDSGEGTGDLPDELSLKWRGFPGEGNMPEDFCRDHWTDQDLFPIEAGNIQVH